MAMMSTSNMNYSSRGGGGFPGTPYGSGPAGYQGMYPPGGAIPPAGGPPGIPGGPNDAQVTFGSILLKVNAIVDGGGMKSALILKNYW